MKDSIKNIQELKKAVKEGLESGIVKDFDTEDNLRKLKLKKLKKEI